MIVFHNVIMTHHSLEFNTLKNTLKGGEAHFSAVFITLKLMLVPLHYYFTNQHYV